MSKSKGNILDPEFFLGEYGADAVRYWASTVIPGDDAYVKEQDFVRGRKTVIKLFNAAKLVKMLTDSTESIEPIIHPKFPVNVWIMSKLNDTISKYRSLMDEFQVSRARTELDNFFWNTYCDNYLEISKAMLRDEKNLEEGVATEIVNTCNFSMMQILILYAPILPFITEELYENNPMKRKKSIHLESILEPMAASSPHGSVDEFDYIVSILSKIRGLKSSMKLSMSARIESVVLSGDVQVIEKYSNDIRSVMNIGEIVVKASSEVNASLL